MSVWMKLSIFIKFSTPDGPRNKFLQQAMDKSRDSMSTLGTKKFYSGSNLQYTPSNGSGWLNRYCCPYLHKRLFILRSFIVDLILNTPLLTDLDGSTGIVVLIYIKDGLS